MNDFHPSSEVRFPEGTVDETNYPATLQLGNLAPQGFMGRTHYTTFCAAPEAAQKCHCVPHIPRSHKVM